MHALLCIHCGQDTSQRLVVLVCSLPELPVLCGVDMSGWDSLLADLLGTNHESSEQSALALHPEASQACIGLLSLPAGETTLSALSMSQAVMAKFTE
eukprot:6468454-Amphidinium_carterae.1